MKRIKGSPKFQIVAETIPAGAQHEKISMVADGRGEAGACTETDGHDKWFLIPGSLDKHRVSAGNRI